MGTPRGGNGDEQPPGGGGPFDGVSGMPPEWGPVVIPDDASALDTEAAVDPQGVPPRRPPVPVAAPVAAADPAQPRGTLARRSAGDHGHRRRRHADQPVRRRLARAATRRRAATATRHHRRPPADPARPELLRHRRRAGHDPGSGAGGGRCSSTAASCERVISSLTLAVDPRVGVLVVTTPDPYASASRRRPAARPSRARRAHERRPERAGRERAAHRSAVVAAGRRPAAPVARPGRPAPRGGARPASRCPAANAHGTLLLVTSDWAVAQVVPTTVPIDGAQGGPGAPRPLSTTSAAAARRTASGRGRTPSSPCSGRPDGRGAARQDDQHTVGEEQLPCSARRRRDAASVGLRQARVGRARRRGCAGRPGAPPSRRRPNARSPCRASRSSITRRHVRRPARRAPSATGPSGTRGR